MESYNYTSTIQFNPILQICVHNIVSCWNVWQSLSDLFLWKTGNVISTKNSFQLFVCLEFIVPLENCLLLWWRHHCRWRAANFDLCSALMAIEQCGSLTCYTHCDTGLPYNDHLQRPVTLTSVADRLAVELSIPDFTT